MQLNAVAPGPVREVEAGEGPQTLQGPSGDVAFSSTAEVSNVALFLASGLSAAVNGQVLSVNGGRI